MSTRTSLKAASLLTQVTFLSISSILYVSSNPAQAANLTCPPPAQTPKDGDANGDGKPDWFLEEQIDAKGNKVQIWCLDKAGGQFGQRYVPKMEIQFGLELVYLSEESIGKVSVKILLRVNGRS